jgi:hypothetical protein
LSKLARGAVVKDLMMRRAKLIFFFILKGKIISLAKKMGLKPPHL